MVVHLLPETMGGYDTDDLLGYSTPKIALIRDRYIGCLYYLLVTLAMMWVLGGQLLWRNEHFMMKDVKGTPRIFISHPTVNQCDSNEEDCLADFKPLEDLPYCTEHLGDALVDHPAHCAFADRHTIFPDGTVGSPVFIPTSVTVLEEVQHCRPSPENGHSCDNEYKKRGDGTYYLNETKLTYYADIEDYTVQFTSTYHRENIAGTSLDHPGFYMQCEDKDNMRGQKLKWKARLKKRKAICEKYVPQKIECMPGANCEKGRAKSIKEFKLDKDSFKDMDLDEQESSLLEEEEGDEEEEEHPKGRIRGTHRHRHHGTIHLINHKDSKKEKDEIIPTPDVYASTWGDTFKLGKLISLANVDLDRHFNMDGLTARMSGTIIEVEATYSNLRKILSSFGFSQVRYKYRVKERMLPYVSKESLHPDQPEDYPLRRRFMVQHGILIDFKVGGEFGFFSIVYLLIMLTTSLALLATAHKVADVTAIYIHPRKKNYFHEKYDISPDFSEMWTCPTCGYFNLEADKYCKGLDKWESPLDERTPMCGLPRPASTMKA